MFRALALAVVLVGLVPAARAEEHSPAEATAVVLSAIPPVAKPGELRLHFKVPHPHALEEARARTQYLFDYWKKRYGVVSRWDGNRAVASGTIMGVTFTAWVVVTDKEVGGESTDPGFFTRSLAYNYIDKKLKKYMHPNYDEP